MQIGYARVSTSDQNLNLQENALNAQGCDKVFTDVGSGGDFTRSGLKAVLEFLREGDVLVVWRLDRLGRSLPDLLATIRDLEERGIGFKSLTESIDTLSSGGKLIFQIFGALAEFERNLIRERTKAGLIAARARGKKGGRPKRFNKNTLTIAKTLYAAKQTSVSEICRTLKVSKSTLYRNLKIADLV